MFTIGDIVRVKTGYMYNDAPEDVKFYDRFRGLKGVVVHTEDSPFGLSMYGKQFLTIRFNSNTSVSVFSNRAEKL